MKENYSDRYKEVQVYIVPQDREDKPYWADSSTPIDSKDINFENIVIEHIENEILTIGSFKKYLDDNKGGSIDSWMKINDIRLKWCKMSTVDFYENHEVDSLNKQRAHLQNYIERSTSEGVKSIFEKKLANLYDK